VVVINCNSEKSVMRSIFEKRILTVEEFQEFVQKVDYFISSLISLSEPKFACCLNYLIIF